MDRYIHEQNLAHYRKVLSETNNPATRHTVLKLLADEQARVNPFPRPHAREGADGQAMVCPLLRGSSPTRWVAPKHHQRAPR
jgi:hypothetical protein